MVQSKSLEDIAQMLNEAVALDPRLWSLFDVMIPCANVVGLATPLELMQVDKSLALANVLGVINGISGDEETRISIIVENKHERTQRRFVVTRIGLRNEQGHSESSPDQQDAHSDTQARD